MKRGLTLLVVMLAASGCYDVTPKITAPPSIGTARAFLWTMVIAPDGKCITGATLTVVRGQDSGTAVTPDANCDVWSYSGGYTFENLTPLVPMTLRASAAGYVDEERTVSPEAHEQTAFLFELSPR
jgi:hypothetical protein